LNEGLIKTSWYSGTAVTPAPGQPAFSLVFKALADTGPDNWVRLDQQAMVAEAYTVGLETLGIGFVFENAFEGNSSFLHFPARPNPFRESTAIGFQLPEAGGVTLVITDLAGRQVKRLAGHFGAGYGKFEVKREELGPSGLFLYQLRSEHGSGGGKLLISDW